MAKRIEDFTVKENKRLNNDFFLLELAGNTYLPQIKPGQFVQVRVDDSPSTFLRRPISIHDINYEQNTLKLLIQILGRGTEKLSQAKAGQVINMAYPLGNSFSMPAAGERILLVGGGCGIAPLLFLGKYLKTNGFTPEILLGFRNSGRLIEYEDYAAIGPVHISTEDGSRGEKGLVTDNTVLKEQSFDRICCCGPERMMKAVSDYCKEKNIICEVSLEHLMACGFGVCLCCVTETVNGNVCTCTDGPVFNTKELKW